MSQTLSPSVAHCYDLARVARVRMVSHTGVYGFLNETQPNTIARRRPGPRMFLLARTRGQRRRGALYMNLEGEPAVGKDLRYNQRDARSTRQVRLPLQRNLELRPARRSYPNLGACRSIPG